MADSVREKVRKIFEMDMEGLRKYIEEEKWEYIENRIDEMRKRKAANSKAIPYFIPS